ncbi:MAG: stage III sporulation protein AB [Oscillospiraceae bacterium]
MIKAVGAFMIVSAFFLWGRSRAEELKAHARLLSALLSSLELIRSEVTARLTPIPEIAERLAASGPGETREFFGRLGAELTALGEREFSEIWSSCAAELKLREDELSALADAGRSLGRYGVREQDAALSRCMEILGAAAADARAEAAGGGRLWTGLGITAGLILAVALL